MLQRGGNAVDAALATAIALTVVEPCSNGLGSDLFAIVWDGAALSGLNASGRAPEAWTPARFAGLEGMPRTGWDTVTIPGAVSGWVALSRRFGKLSFADLFAPAIRYAGEGYAVSPVVAEKWAKAVPILGQVEGFAEHFLPRGRAPEVGEIFASDALARSLKKIAMSEGEAFYRGDLAEAMVAHARAHQGAHTLADFDAHRCDWVTPLAHDYHGHTIHEIPPNGQGIAALMALGIIENFDLGSQPVDSVAMQHLEIEAMKLAFADVYHYVSDPATMAVTPAQLLDRGYLAARARLIDRTRAQDFGHGIPPPGGTVYLAAADEHGMMVSLIQSNYMGFGSGIVVPGTGISMQNRGTGFSLQPDHPNLVGGGKRPFHTIIPGFVTRDGAPLRGIWRDGRPDPAAGASADAGAPDRLSARIRRRCSTRHDGRSTAVSRSTSSPMRRHRLREGLRAPRPFVRVGSRFVHGFRRRTIHRPRRARLCRRLGPAARRAGRRVLNPFESSAFAAGLHGGQRQQFGQIDPAASRLGLGQRISFAHCREAPPRQLLIALRALDLPGELLLGQLAHDPCRHAGDQHSRRHDHAGLDERHRRDDSRFADHRIVVDYGVHADQRVGLDHAAMQDRPMADVAVVFDDGIGAGKAVHHTRILDVRAGAKLDAAEIATKRCGRADITPGADDDVADQHGARMHERARIDDRRHTVD